MIAAYPAKENEIVTSNNYPHGNIKIRWKCMKIRHISYCTSLPIVYKLL